MLLSRQRDKNPRWQATAEKVACSFRVASHCSEGTCGKHEQEAEFFRRNESTNQDWKYKVSAATAVSRLGEEFARGTMGPASAAPSEPTIAEKIRRHGFATIAVRDNRLFPLVRKGDLVFIRHVEIGAVRTGEIVLVEHEGRPALRRVVRRRAKQARNAAPKLVTRGSRPRIAVELISGRRFLGHAIRIHRGKKHIDLESAEQRAMGKLSAGICHATLGIGRTMRTLRAILLA
jgi:hypothetical protein